MNKFLIFTLGVLLGTLLMMVRAITHNESEINQMCSGTQKILVTQDTIRTLTCEVRLKDSDE